MHKVWYNTHMYLASDNLFGIAHVHNCGIYGILDFLQQSLGIIDQLSRVNVQSTMPIHFFIDHLSRNIKCGYPGISGSRVRAQRTDPILSFLHTFSPKSVRIGGRCSPMGRRRPMGNPGSTIAWVPFLQYYVPMI